jgi:hypothetical protein
MERTAENGEISTNIVKELSRFGREQVEMGRLAQVVYYPSLGIHQYSFRICKKYREQ